MLLRDFDAMSMPCGLDLCVPFFEHALLVVDLLIPSVLPEI